MNATVIRDLYQAAPFRPFELVMPNGSAILVDHPEFMMFSPDFRTIYISKLDGGVHFIDAKMIVSIKVHPPGSNTRSKKKK